MALRSRLQSHAIYGFFSSLVLILAGCERAIEFLPPLPQLEPRSSQPARPAQTTSTAKIEASVRDRINQVRQQNNLKPLKNNEKLAQVARRYSQQMAEKRFFSHTGPDGSTLAQRVHAGGISYWVVGENLFTSTNILEPVSAAVKGWMDSPGHRENILRPVYAETGVGVWRRGSTYYITQLFLKR